MTPDYAAVLTVLYPDALWGLNDNDLSTLSWDESNTVGKPSKKTLDAAWPQVDNDRQRAQTEAARRDRYQADTDGIYFDAIANGKPLDDWKKARDQVKTDLPNPPEVKR